MRRRTVLKGLAATATALCAGPLIITERTIAQTRTIYVNTWGGGDPAAPFGGYKASGFGREKGHANLDAYLETKTVWVQL